MSKYYTPSIEEFHPGFEYEALWGIENINGEWLKETFSSAQSTKDLEEIYRVKHLDQEDIESFGFIDISRTRGNYDSSDVREDKVYLLNQELLSIKESDERIRIILRIMKNGQIRIQKRYYYTVGQAAYPPYGCWRYSWRDHIFIGTIKNKSEFARVLKQVGVL